MDINIRRRSHEDVSVAPAVENRCVFSARLKAISYGSGDRSAGGRRFHVAGPVTAKLRLVYFRFDAGM